MLLAVIEGKERKREGAFGQNFLASLSTVTVRETVQWSHSASMIKTALKPPKSEPTERRLSIMGFE